MRQTKIYNFHSTKTTDILTLFFAKVFGFRRCRLQIPLTSIDFRRYHQQK